MSDDLTIGDRVRLITGKHEGTEGRIMGMSPEVAGRKVVLIATDAGRKIVALPRDLEKIPRLLH